MTRKFVISQLSFRYETLQNCSYFYSRLYFYCCWFYSFIYIYIYIYIYKLFGNECRCRAVCALNWEADISQVEQETYFWLSEFLSGVHRSQFLATESSLRFSTTFLRNSLIFSTMSWSLGFIFLHISKTLCKILNVFFPSPSTLLLLLSRHMSFWNTIHLFIFHVIIFLEFT